MLEESLMSKFRTEGASWQGLRAMHSNLFWARFGALRALPPFIGGIHVERGTTDQFDDGKQPYTPISKEEQVRTLKFLCAQVFADGQFQYPTELIPYLQPQRRGFDFFGNTEDPKIHENILDIQSYMLYRLLNEDVFQRLSDTQKYGGEMTAHELVKILTKAIFAADRWGKISDERKNLQLYYTEDLIGLYRALEKGTDKAAVANGLKMIKGYSKPPLLFGGDAASQAHRAHIQKILTAW